MKINLKKLLIVLLSFSLTNGTAYLTESGPKIKATIGEIWPRPKFEQRFDNILLDPKIFEFVLVGETCDILDEALIRYTRIIRKSIDSPIYEIQLKIFESSLITKIAVNLTSKCERLPHLEMDESYRISGAEYISANSIWGILRALETYSQAITPTLYGKLNVPLLRIIDSPRFPHRGLLLDTARHYMTIDTIFTILDGMAYNKLNVFHWHIVDDQSFPYQSVKFPELSEKGAYIASMIYTQKNISDIIEYARMRGIRVVAEFDIPAHTRSWGNSHPEILTDCYFYGENVLGPMHPLKSKTYNFLHKFFSEVLNVFQDQFIHLGGDENDLDCWRRNNKIQRFVTRNRTSFSNLQQIFLENISKFVINKSFVPIFWQEAMINNFRLPDETVVQVWLGNWRQSLQNFTNFGYRVLLSECWYLNYVLPDQNWIKFYNCEPSDFDGTPKQKKLVIGGEACLWSEYINSNNVIQTIFPRLSAVAERLWSQNEDINIDKVQQRLEEHICRMILRGIPVPPVNGPGIC